MVVVHTKLTVNLTEKAANALDAMADMTGETKTDTVNRALILSEAMHRHQAAGGDVLLRRPGGNEVEIIRLL